MVAAAYASYRGSLTPGNNLMVTLDVYPPTSLTPREQTGLPRLFAAAVVNHQFREALLREPETALANGYLGQTFLLTDREKMLIKSIRAESLVDLAQKLNRALKSGH